MLALVIARILFALGFIALLLLSGKGLIPGDPLAFVLIVFVVLCEAFIARKLKARPSPPLTSRQKSLALIPWLLPALLIAGAFMLPSLTRG